MRGLWPWIEQASKRLHRNLLAIALATASPGPSRARSRISAEDYAPSGVTRAGAANVGSSEVKLRSTTSRRGLLPGARVTASCMKVNAACASCARDRATRWY